MNYLRFTALLLLFVALPAFAATDTKDLDARYQRSVASTAGQEYEKKAVKAFWGDLSFMKECVPPDAPTATPLTIYFEVSSDGQMGKIVIRPENAVAKCIIGHVKNRKFPIPPGDFVERIYLKFTQ